MPTIDFNGDGHDDLFLKSDYAYSWVGQPDGTFAFWRVWFVPGAVVGVGDFSNDGRTDLLIRHPNGLLSVYLIKSDQSGFPFEYSSYNAYVPNDWSVAGTGDFNGDGHDDIIWRNANGAFSEWLAQPVGFGVNFVSNHENASTVMPQDWHVAGTGDFDGDGRDDVLWRHESGLVNNWLSQPDSSFKSNANLWINPGVDWKVAGIGDFNGDGRADIIWRNDNGAFSEWLAQANGSFMSNHDKASSMVPLDWHVAGTGDYDGDGRDDVLWRHDAGGITGWLAQPDGGFVSSNSWFYEPPHFAIQPNPSGAGLWDY